MPKFRAILLATFLGTLANAREAGAAEVETVILPGTQMTFVRVAGGSFLRGSPATERGRKDDEAQSRVVVDNDFYIAEIPVTRGQFAAFVAERAFVTESEKGKSGGFGWTGAALEQKPAFNWKTPGFPQTDDHPVVLVTWNDARVFAAWVATATHRTVRLPTESEYELAARGGTTTPWYTGESEADARRAGWFKHGGAGTHPVKQKEANALGLHDMLGHTYAWCSDALPEDRRALRGGSWMRDETRGRAASRHQSSPGTRNAEIGFRLVMEKAAPAGRSVGAPATPAHDATKPSDGPSESGGGGEESHVVRNVIGGIVAAVLAIVGALALFGRRRPKVASVVSTKADGFFASTLSRTRVTLAYRCTVNGRLVQGEFAPEPGAAMFVYTGGRPFNIQFRRVGDASTETDFGDVDVQTYGSEPSASPARSQVAASSPGQAGGTYDSSGSTPSYTGGGGDFGGGGASSSYDETPLGNPRAY